MPFVEFSGRASQLFASMLRGEPLPKSKTSTTVGAAATGGELCFGKFTVIDLFQMCSKCHTFVPQSLKRLHWNTVIHTSTKFLVIIQYSGYFQEKHAPRGGHCFCLEWFLFKMFGKTGKTCILDTKSSPFHESYCKLVLTMLCGWSRPHHLLVRADFSLFEFEFANKVPGRSLASLALGPFHGCCQKARADPWNAHFSWYVLRLGRVFNSQFNPRCKACFLSWLAGGTPGGLVG